MDLQHNPSYYELNKDKWLIYVDCKCGGKYNRNSRTHHFRSNKHKLFVKDERIKELEAQLDAKNKTI